MIKKAFIAFAVLVVIAASVAGFFYHRITSKAAKPQQIPELAGKQELLATLAQRIQTSRTAATPAAQAPAADANRVTIEADELTALISTQLPMEGLKLKIDLSDGLADLKLSVPTKELIKTAGSSLGAFKDTLEKNFVWVNVNAKVSMKFADGRLAITVRETREPTLLDAKQLQPVIDDLLKGLPAGPLQVPLGATTLTVSHMEIEGSQAVLTLAGKAP